MWEKMFRKGKSLEYRKKYRCPKCGQYTLLLIHDMTCECKEGCDVENIDGKMIENIMQGNDFNGYFTSEEIKENFWTDFEEIEKLYNQVKVEQKPHLIKEKENKKIIELFYKTDNLDKMLDDVVVNYYNYYRINELEQYKPYNYLITLIEDMHYYMNLTCKDMYLLDLSISGTLLYKEYMYSGRFFGNNAIDHLFQANERMYVILGLLCGYAFYNDLSKNRTYNIHKFLKKENLYKKIFKKDIDELCSNSFYSSLKEIRDNNEHDMSYEIKEVIASKINDLDGDKADEEFYLPLIKNIIFCLNKMFDILKQIIEKIDDIALYGMSSFPMYEKFAKEDIRIKFRQYDMKFYEKLERYNSNIVENIIGFGGDLFIADTYFRLDEVLHCIRDIYNYYNQCDEISKVYFGDFIGIDYIIYSSITRLYSCYDKIAKYIKRIYKEYEKIKYFEDCGKITSSNIIQRKINSIIKNEYYCYLQEVRNMIYHNLRAGIIFGENANRYYINLLTQIILENELLLFEFLEDIKPIKKGKIERNAPCPCGSGKKYKKCHGRYLSFRRM